MNKINEHILFESVMTYSIDNSNHENNEILKTINLNANTFYNSGIYKNRPLKEKKIRDAILSPSGAVKIIGKAGTGKTTVSTKVLREFGVEYLFQKFDIKKDKRIENPLYESESELGFYLDKVLLGYLNKTINKLNISRDKVLEYYLNSSNKIEEHISKNSKFTAIEGKLIQQFHRQRKSSEVSIVDWIKKIKYKSDLDKLINDLYEALAPENLAYYLINGLGKYKSAIFFWDNVDSIIDDKIRTAFFNIIDKYQSEKSDCISIIISFRSNNPSLLELTDVGSFMDKTIDMDLIEETIDTDASKKVDKDKQINDFSGLTQKQIYYLKRKSYSKRNEEFSLDILHKRVKFLFDRVKLNSIQVDLGKLYEIKKLTFAFLHDKHLRITTSAISNYDRRESLKILARFINYLIENKYTKYIETIEYSANQMIIYESYFYYWLANNSLVFSNNIKNVFTEYNNWVRDDLNHNGCLSDMQLMNVVLNSTDPSPNNMQEARKLTVSGVIKEFKNIGIPRKEVLERIFRIYKDKNKHLGFIELSRYYGIESPNRIKDEDEIWLTPRGENYVLYTNFKYTYIYSLLKKNGALSKDFRPVSIESFKEVFSFLVNLGAMYVQGLINIKNKLRVSFPNKDEKFWIDKYYSMRFCITSPSRNKNNFKQKYPYLHFSNLINSHLKYMDLLAKKNLDVQSNVDLSIPYKNYIILSANFESIVDEIIISDLKLTENEIVEKISNNINWVV